MNELDSVLIGDLENGKEAAVSGNGAIARGLMESSVKVITGYPGAPCAEIVENLLPFSQEYDFHIEWSVNEKVALEVAAAAAISGVRSAFITKHVGMNVASDPLVHICYAGVNAGMVIIVADDPGADTSNVEEDSRIFARLAKIPGMEPANQQEAKDMVAYAFTVSEKIKLPVLIRATNSLLYSRGRVLGGRVQVTARNAEFKRKDLRWFIGGKNAVKQHQWLYKQQKELEIISEGSPFNALEWAAEKRYGIICSGVNYYYAKEAIKELKIEDKVSLLKLACFNPFPKDSINKFLEKTEEILIVEELEPVIEEAVKTIAFEGGKKIRIYGKSSGHFPETGYFLPDDVRAAIAGLWLKEGSPGFSKNPKAEPLKNEFDRLSASLPGSSIIFCPGCPHRASLYVLKRALTPFHDEFVVSSDIGCYQLGVKKPHYLADTVFCMGASIGTACGFYQAGLNKKIIAIIGDSTFFHAGIPALINSSYTGVDLLVYILDNKTIAMTGLQPYAGTGLSTKGEKAKLIRIEDIVKSCKIDYLRIINPFQPKKAQKILEEALMLKGQRVIISRSACSQMKNKNKGREMKLRKYRVDDARCRRCKKCILALGCPAISSKDSGVWINQLLCSGCGLCSQICDYKAIGF